MHFGITEQQEWDFFNDNGEKLELIGGGNAKMRALDFVLSMDNAKEPKYKDLVKLPKRSVLYLGK